MVDVDKGLLGQQPDRRTVDHQHLAAEHGLDPDPVRRQLAVRGGVFAQREQRGVLVGGGNRRRNGDVHGRLQGPPGLSGSAFP
jgi:hypothetical protein